MNPESKRAMKKHKLSALIAFGVLAAAFAVGVWAINAGGTPQGSAADKHALATPADPVTAATVAPTSDGEGVAEPGLMMPKGIVDPMSGKTYCATAKLLAIYAHQSYGLDPKLHVVDGKKFDRRLKVIAATYARLADQAATQPKAGDVAKHWKAMAVAASAAEENLRVSGLQVQSQEMIVQLAQLAKSVQDNLPLAAKTLKAACGLSPAIFGS